MIEVAVEGDHSTYPLAASSNTNFFHFIFSPIHHHHHHILPPHIHHNYLHHYNNTTTPIVSVTTLSNTSFQAKHIQRNDGRQTLTFRLREAQEQDRRSKITQNNSRRERADFDLAQHCHIKRRPSSEQRSPAKQRPTPPTESSTRLHDLQGPRDCLQPAATLFPLCDDGTGGILQVHAKNSVYRT